jgi:hypothetical protein
VLEGNDCGNAGTASVERTPDPWDKPSALGGGWRSSAICPDRWSAGVPPGPAPFAAGSLG